MIVRVRHSVVDYTVRDLDVWGDSEVTELVEKRQRVEHEQSHEHPLERFQRTILQSHPLGLQYSRYVTCTLTVVLYCLSNAMHSIGQNIKSPECPCVRPCVRP